MPNRSTLIETERAMKAHLGDLNLDYTAAHAMSSLYRAANAARNHITNRVLRQRDLTWTGFVVLWVVWIWDGLETRHAAEHAAISKATLTGVVKTLEARGWMIRESDEADRRLVHLRLTDEGTALMHELFPEFNAIEAEVIGELSQRKIADLTSSLRTIVTTVEEIAEGTDGAGGTGDTDSAADTRSA